MQVVTVKTSEEKTRYYLAQDDGTPVEPVLQYLRFRDDGGAARNTLRLTCIFMKHYFTYLEKRELRWKDVGSMIWQVFLLGSNIRNSMRSVYH